MLIFTPSFFPSVHPLAVTFLGNSADQCIQLAHLLAHSKCDRRWSPALPMGTALEGGEGRVESWMQRGGEGGSVKQNV